MKKLIGLLALSLFSFTANASWFTLYSANCQLSNGVLSYSSVDNRADYVSISIGYLKKEYETDSKVYTSSAATGQVEVPTWQYKDSMTTYRAQFNFDYKKLTKKVKLSNVKTTVFGQVPLPIPIWYQVGAQVMIASGTCQLLIGPYVY
jgi:hypothetical protein